MHLQRSTVLSLAVCAALGGLAGAAHANPNPSPATPAAEESLGEVMVTARRREESLQEVPIAVTALSADMLEATGAADLTAVSQSVPNVTLENSRATNNTLTAFIRGVGQQDPIAGFEQGVGIYLDDVYLNRPQGAILDVYDVERVEVLRGPQGTLYGRNTIGGAVKYVTRRLDPDQSTLRTRLTVGNYGQLDAVAVGSLRASDTFRLGGAIAKLTRDGFGTNLATGEENYDKDVLSARVSAEWQPTDALFVRLAADYTDDDSTQRQGYRLRPTVSTVQRQLLSNRYDSNGATPLLSPIATSVFEAKGYSLQVEWNLDEQWTLKSITAYREDEARLPIDFDGTPAPSFDVPVIYENDQTSQEFQLVYEGERLAVVAGAYYLDAWAFHAFDVRFNTVSSFTLGDVDTKTWAIFGEATWDLTDALSLTVGGRYTDDQRDALVNRETFLGPRSRYFGGTGASVTVPIVVNGQQVVPTFVGSRTDTAFTPRVILGWQANPDVNLYVSYSEGFKGGLFDPRGNFSNPDIRRGVEPETVESYEFGLKTQLFDGMATVNTAVFFADYTDVQIPGSVVVTTPTGTTFQGTLTNAGAAEMKGVEFESLWRFTDAFSATLAFGYIDAEYTEFIVNNANVAGLRDVQNTPDWTGNVGLTYGWQVGPGRLSLTGSASYRGATQQFETASPGLDEDAYWLLDAGLNWASDDGKWKLGLHGRNLADEEYVTSGYFFPGAATDDSVLAFYGNPRQYSATLEYRF
jgi:iron complex outermembrane receptor protein